jgi:tRNA (mo5U34)-methyltransferase
LRNPRPAREEVPNWNPELATKGWWHSFQFPDGEHVTGVRSIGELNSHLAHFQLPDDLRGKRVLDVGAWDGWFSFEMERRGAEVVAIDCWDNPNFRYAHSRLASRVRYRVQDAYDLRPGELGHFDIVLFFGVLYHLKHPLLALEKVCSMSRDIMCLESYVLDSTMREGRNSKRALMAFYEADELGGQTDNWTAPNATCLLSWCRTAGFARVSMEALSEHRAYITCHRTWGELENPNPAPPPQISKAIHNLNHGVNFSAIRDEYVSCWFATHEQQLTRRDVQPQVGKWGTVPLSVQPSGEGLWQANFKLPPGLDPGFHEVRLRTSRSTFSTPVRIAVDVSPAPPGQLSITGVCDGQTWKNGGVRLSPNGVIALWAVGLPGNADVNNIGVTLGGRRLPVSYVSVPEPLQPTQINVEVPADFPVGISTIQIRIGDETSDSLGLTVTSD